MNGGDDVSEWVSGDRQATVITNKATFSSKIEGHDANSNSTQWSWEILSRIFIDNQNLFSLLKLEMTPFIDVYRIVHFLLLHRLHNFEFIRRRNSGGIADDLPIERFERTWKKLHTISNWYGLIPGNVISSSSCFQWHPLITFILKFDQKKQRIIERPWHFHTIIR